MADDNATTPHRPSEPHGAPLAVIPVGRNRSLHLFVDRSPNRWARVEVFASFPVGSEEGRPRFIAALGDRAVRDMIHVLQAALRQLDGGPGQSPADGPPRRAGAPPASWESAKAAGIAGDGTARPAGREGER
jgi:hypothetical protein